MFAISEIEDSRTSFLMDDVAISNKHKQNTGYYFVTSRNAGLFMMDFIFYRTNEYLS